MKPEQKETLPLPEAVTHLLEECRMVLPGLQALLGFQFIAIFNAGFSEKLTPTEQRLHLFALSFPSGRAEFLIDVETQVHILSSLLQQKTSMH